MNIIAQNIRFRQWNCDVALCTYADGSDALVLLDHEDSERIATATCCLAGYGYRPPEGCAAIKGYSENEGMLAVLVAAGIVEETGQSFEGDFVDFPIVRILKRVDVSEVAA